MIRSLLSVDVSDRYRVGVLLQEVSDADATRINDDPAPDLLRAVHLTERRTDDMSVS
jgi:hypothetical protein